ncbi:MAG: acetyl-CoA C-acetyltransferase [Acidimicrobiaceae bacterium]|jgi:acetyl-CoA C-acetyltransferase
MEARLTAPDVFVLGGAQTDFARNWTATGGSLFELLSDAVLGALDATGVAATDIDVAHVGNLAAELFCGQAQLGGMVATIDPAFAELPTARHEAACASGSVATLAAMADLQAGNYDCALVVGVELMRNVDGQTAAEHLGSAAWVGREATDATFPWPYLFSEIADVYGDRYGLDYPHLARIAELNFDNATRNPNAQSRDWRFGTDSFTEDDELNPVIEGRLRKQDCGRITDGAAAVVLASPRFAAEHARRRGRSLDDFAVIKGWGHRTAPMLLADKLHRSAASAYVFPHLRRAITEAYARAGISGPDDLDAIETHDCFTITEYAAIDHFGITDPGESWKAIEEGTIDPKGRLPVNPSGGLIGLGHPVGATGVRMLLDATKQVTDTAGDYQVPDAHTVATLNIGGSCTTVVSFIVGR